MPLRRFPVWSILLFAYAALHGLWTVFHWGGEAVTAKVAGLPLLLPSVAAALAAGWRASRETAEQQKRGWTILAVATSTYALANAIWGYYTVVYASVPFPTLADGLYVLFPWLVFAALTQLTGSQLTVFSRARVALNTLIILFTLGLIEWSLLLRGTVPQAGSVLAALTTVLYPLGDLVMLGGVLFTLQHAWDHERRAFLLPLLSAVGLFVLGNIIYAVQIATERYQVGSPLDLTWSLGMVFFALAALRPMSGTPVPAAVQSRGESASAALILALTLGAYAALIPLMLGSDTRALDTLVAFCALASLGTLVFLRQKLDARENRSLSLDLRASNARLSERVEEAVGELEAQNVALSEQSGHLARQNREIQTLADLADLLQACLTLEEARTVLVRAAGRLFPGTRGTIAIINASRNLIETFAAWGDQEPGRAAQVFAPHDCWALRRGHPHELERDGERLSVACHQLRDHVPVSYLCLPLVAQGETVGVMRFSTDTPHPTWARDIQAVAQQAARQVALALANLGLRESLRRQSIRDPLTGLHNRRYLEETLEREVRRAERARLPLSVLVFDVDHFKTFNDTFGHEAGDTVLQELGKLLRHHFREEDVVCRYGGEEFVTVLLDTGSAEAVERAQRLREAVSLLSVSARDQALGAITVSVGVAALSTKGEGSAELIHLADQALYQAKREGRNRVVLAGAAVPQN